MELRLPGGVKITIQVTRVSDNARGLYHGIWYGYHDIQWLNREYPSYRLLNHYSLHTMGEFIVERDELDMTETNFEMRNKAFEEMNAILDANGDNANDPAYREAFRRWQEIALGVS